jgi:hypothetical protein
MLVHKDEEKNKHGGLRDHGRCGLLPSVDDPSGMLELPSQAVARLWFVRNHTMLLLLLLLLAADTAAAMPRLWRFLALLIQGCMR